MRIVVPPAGSTPESIVADITSSLVDTRVIEVVDDELGGRPSRAVRMESDLGTTIVGFKVGPGVFVTAGGVDRSYEVHVISTSAGPIVIWVEAARDGFDAVRRDVDAIVSTLEVG